MWLFTRNEGSVKNNQPPQAAHYAITTAWRSDNTRSSALVRSQSTKFMARPSRERESMLQNRIHISAIFPPFLQVIVFIICFSIFKVGLGIFDFCAISRQLILKDSISSPNFRCSCSYAERALWCRDSKRQALGTYFFVRICYEFLISKCRSDWDLGLCIFLVLAFINPLSDGKIRFFLRAKRLLFRKSLLLSGSLFTSTQRVHWPRSQSPLQSDIRNL